MADYCADLTSRFAQIDSLAPWRDFSERLHQLATEPEDAERDSAAEPPVIRHTAGGHK
jgi:hypothetical protein